MALGPGRVGVREEAGAKPKAASMLGLTYLSLWISRAQSLLGMSSSKSLVGAIQDRDGGIHTIRWRTPGASTFYRGGKVQIWHRLPLKSA